MSDSSTCTTAFRPREGRWQVAAALFLALLAGSATAQERRLETVLGEVLQRAGLPINPLTPRIPAALLKSAKATVAPVTAAAPKTLPVVDGMLVRFADAAVTRRAQDNEAPPAELAGQVLAASGQRLVYARALTLGHFVFEFTAPVNLQQAQDVAARLRALPAVAQVELNVRARTRALPNDPYFALQRSLQASAGQPGSIDAVGAWQITTGSSDTVVAIVDTGITNHAEFAGRVLPGFDFLSSRFQANDGDSRDANATDPGTWVTAAEAQQNTCEVTDSVWHGTHVAGILAARGNNGYGIAGLDWNTRILPVRVLGKCGGSLSDVIDGMLWAAGVPVQGAPVNPTPANVINMSLGVYSTEGCTPAFQEAIRQVRARGVLIVAAAGNDADEAAHYMPATCPGVLAVGAVDPNGFRAPYSNYSEHMKIALSAPGGDKKLGDAGMIPSTANTGLEVPGKDAFSYMEGTSMASPHVAGAATLALAANPQLSADELRALLMLTSHDFNAGSTCMSAWPTCGVGIVDAGNMVRAAQALKGYRTVVEFYNPDYGHYFRTGDRDEPALVESGALGNWQKTEEHFVAWRDASSGAVPVCRMYNAEYRSHFYTANMGDCDWLRQNTGWKFESIAFYAKLPVDGACPAGARPVHRFYNNRHAANDGNHRFVTNREAYEARLTSQGWSYEGVAFCAVA